MAATAYASASRHPVAASSHILIYIWRQEHPVKRLNLWKIVFRSWFYFRTGYNLYLAFLIGFASNLVVLFKLGVTDNKYLAPLFPSLTIFTIIGLLVAVPIAIVAGLYHMKRTGAYAADASVSLEANPYIYKVIPGKEQEVFLPLAILTAKGLARVMDQLKTMRPEERDEFQKVLAKADSLLNGQEVGVATRRTSKDTAQQPQTALADP